MLKQTGVLSGGKQVEEQRSQPAGVFIEISWQRKPFAEGKTHHLPHALPVEPRRSLSHSTHTI